MKKILLIIAIAFIYDTTYAQKGEIKGVVTYFFNNAQGDRPDLGATVYVVDSAKCPKYSEEISFQFDLATIKNNTQQDTSYKYIDEKNALNNNEIKNSDFANSATIDATGNYSFELSPATYYVLIRSKGRNSLNMTDLMGNVYVRKVNLHPDQQVDVSHNFGLQ